MMMRRGAFSLSCWSFSIPLEVGGGKDQLLLYYYFGGITTVAVKSLFPLCSRWHCNDNEKKNIDQRLARLAGLCWGLDSSSSSRNSLLLVDRCRRWSRSELNLCLKAIIETSSHSHFKISKQGRDISFPPWGGFGGWKMLSSLSDPPRPRWQCWGLLPRIQIFDSCWWVCFQEDLFLMVSEDLDLDLEDLLFQVLVPLFGCWSWWTCLLLFLLAIIDASSMIILYYRESTRFSCYLKRKRNFLLSLEGS